jgi:sec-independent protein translocase protein TatC
MTLTGESNHNSNQPAASTPEPADEPAGMTLMGHIEELRKRLLISIVAMLITTVISFSFAEQLIDLLASPIGGIESLQSIEVTETIGVFMRVSLLSGFILALPVILIEAYLFVSAGLKESEKRWIRAGIPVAMILFVSGAAFAQFVMLRNALPFLLGFIDVQAVPRISNYVNFVTNLMFWIGLCFETPLLAFLLAKLNIITAKVMLQQWRIAIVVIAVLAAVITPTVDPINMGLVMAPLIIIYLLSVLFAALAKRR